MGFVKGVLLALATAIAIAVLPQLLQPPVPAEFVHGSCVETFAGVERVYRANFASGLERGSALSVYYKGEPVCDMWGGYAAEAISRPWQQDSISCWFSTTKAVAAIAVLTLVDKGLLDVKKPVAHYWPEFAQKGKAKVTVEQVLSHSAGLTALDTPLTFDHVMNDPAYVSKAFEEQEPNWTPGSKHGYHTLTIGLLMDQLVRRVDPTHRSLQQYFAEDIAEPHGIDFFIGTPLAEHHRAVSLHGISLIDALKTVIFYPVFVKMYYNFYYGGGIAAKSADNPTPGLPGSHDLDTVSVIDWPESRVVPQASSNGMGTARAVAKLMGMVANGELFKPSTLELFNHAVVSGADEIIPLNTTYGYGLSHFVNEEDTSKHRVGAPGHGGQMGFADSNHKFSYAYTTNHILLVTLEMDERTQSLRDEMYEAIAKLK